MVVLVTNGVSANRPVVEIRATVIVELKPYLVVVATVALRVAAYGEMEPPSVIGASEGRALK